MDSSELVLCGGGIWFEFTGIEEMMGMVVDEVGSVSGLLDNMEGICLEKGKELSLNITFLDIITFPFGARH